MRGLALVREWVQRLRGTLGRGRPEAEIEEELRLHLELAVEDARRHGDAGDESVRAARMRAGGVRQAQDAMHDQQGVPWLDDLARDLRHALRTLRRSPIFTIVALLTLALGIGANTAIYQLLDAVRLRPLPVERPQQLAIVQLADLTRWKGRRTSAYPVLTNPLWEQFRDRQRTFSGVLAWSSVDLPLGQETGLRVARGLFVSGDFFEVLGVPPFLGRLFAVADDYAGCGVPAAVVSYGFWMGQLGGDPAAIGRTIVLDSRPVDVIGITPHSFTGLEVGRSYDVAVPLCSHEALGREEAWLSSGTTGFQTDNVTIARVDLSRTPPSPGRRHALTRELLDRIRTAPGVIAAAEVRHVPMGGTGSSLDVWPDGADPTRKHTVRLNAISDGYLETMAIRPIAGRDFDARDTGPASRVAIVNRSFANRLGLEGNAVGQRFRATWSPSEPEAVFEIVGLVPDTKYFTLREDFLPIAFVPTAHIGDRRSIADLMIRSAAPLGDLSAAVRSAAAGLQPGIGADLRPFDATIREGLRRERLMATLSGFFGLLAAFIAAIGLYGVMSYLVVRRTNEIGVRLALGARRRDILAMVLRQAGTLVAIGLVVGTLLALAAAGSARSFVFGLDPYDPMLVAMACGLLAAVATVASILPARRAAWLEPLGALRDE